MQRSGGFFESGVWGCLPHWKGPLAAIGPRGACLNVALLGIVTCMSASVALLRAGVL